MAFELTDKLKDFAIRHLAIHPDATNETFRIAITNAVGSEQISMEEFVRLSKPSPDPEKLFGSDTGDNFIRMKDPSERYNEKRYEAKNKFGQVVVDPVTNRTVMTQSEAAKARAGVYFKHLAHRAGIIGPLSEHERTLLAEVAEKHPWCGKINNEWHDWIAPGSYQKALIDDATSGGLEAVPIEFDSDVITFPLLFGELVPSVDMVPVARGRRMEGASIATPTMAWGEGQEGSAINLFTTTSMVAAIDTTIFPIGGALEVGNDFLADTPVNIGGTLTALVGQRLMAELDDAIANGNGTTQPEGIFNASSVTTVAWGGSTSIDNYESLYFSPGKQYRKDVFRTAFIANDTSYQRAKGIPVGASDARRLFGEGGMGTSGYSNYQLMGEPYRVQNDISNTTIAYGALAKYRLYRRLGAEIRWERGGKELALNSLSLLVYRARYGGRVMDANAFAKTTTAPA